MLMPYRYFLAAEEKLHNPDAATVSSARSPRARGIGGWLFGEGAARPPTEEQQDELASDVGAAGDARQLAAFLDEIDGRDEPAPGTAPSGPARRPRVPDWMAQRRAGPRIGLALGGGAARGWTHLGVLKALKAAGMTADVIVGTSIGSVVGGSYAADQADDLERWALQINKRNLYTYLDVVVGGAGLISGGRLARQLVNELGATRIEQLRCPFAAVATEIGTGTEVWITRGLLVEALRASYAIPGVFEPVKLGGRWLMDGMFVNPLPVSTARALGADIVVAVSLSAEPEGYGGVVEDHGSSPGEDAIFETSHLRGKPTTRRAGTAEQRIGMLGVMMDAFNVSQHRIGATRLAMDAPDVLIAPNFVNYGLFDFHRAAEGIALGEQAASAALPAIRLAIARAKATAGAEAPAP